MLVAGVVEGAGGGGVGGGVVEGYKKMGQAGEAGGRHKKRRQTDIRITEERGRGFGGEGGGGGGALIQLPGNPVTLTDHFCIQPSKKCVHPL